MVDRLQDVVDRGCSTNCKGRDFIWTDEYQVYCCSDKNQCNVATYLRVSSLAIIIASIISLLCALTLSWTVYIYGPLISGNSVVTIRAGASIAIRDWRERDLYYAGCSICFSNIVQILHYYLVTSFITVSELLKCMFSSFLCFWHSASFMLQCS